MVKILKAPLDEDFPIVAPSHIVFTYSDFLFLLHLPIPEVLCVLLEWLKSLNFEEPN